MQNKLLGLEEQKQEKKNEEEKSGKEENITPHTAEPEYIDAAGSQASSGTAQIEEGQAENQNGEQSPQDYGQGQNNGEIPQQQAAPGEAEPSSVPTTPPPQQPY